MYRQYVAELLQSYNKGESSGGPSIQSEKDTKVTDGEKSTEQDTEGSILLPVCKSRSGTLLPPASLPPSSAILGDFSTGLSPLARTFRVFTWGLSVDDKVERRALSTAFSKVKWYCHSNGYDLEEVDLGMYGLDLNIPNTYFEEIRHSRNITTGVIIMLFLNAQTESRHLPSQISKQHFQKLCSAPSITDGEKALLQKWYKLDENFLTPTFVLSEAKEATLEGHKKEGTQDKHQLVMAMFKAAKDVFKTDDSLEFTNKDSSPEEDLFGMICEHLRQTVDEVIANRHKSCSNSDDEPHSECLEHLTVCREKLTGYQERPEIIQSIKDYILSDSKNPLVIHGPPGCGKSTMMAKAASRAAYDWLEKDAGIIVRFVGATSSSSVDSLLLSSIHKQIYRISPAKDFSVILLWPAKVLHTFAG